VDDLKKSKGKRQISKGKNGLSVTPEVRKKSAELLIFAF
jgi:hypothetical protein